MKRVANYVRMSTDKQEDSPERQYSQITPYCEQKQYHVVNPGRYDDLGMSGWDDERPGLARLIADAQAGLFETIVIDEPSRLSRNDPMSFFRTIAGPLSDAGVTVESVSQGPLDWTEIHGILISTVQQYKASAESADTSRRVLTKYQLMLEQHSLQLGKPPYGYRRIWVNQAGDVLHDGVHPPDNIRKLGGLPKLIPGDAKEVQVVRWIFESYAVRDMSASDIARELMARGVRSPRGRERWQPHTICMMLHDLRYVGAYVGNTTGRGKYNNLTGDGIRSAKGRKRVREESPRIKSKPVMYRKPKEDWVIAEGSHEAIIERDLFLKVQHLLKENATRTTPAVNRGDFLFSGLLRCGECGSSMCGHATSTATKRHIKYRCSRYVNGGGGCQLNLVVEDELLEQVIRVIETRFNKDFLDRVRQRARALAAEATADSGRVAAERELSEILAKVATGKGNLAFIPRDCMPEALAQIRQLEQRASRIRADLAEAGRAPEWLQAVEEYLSRLEADIWLVREVFATPDRSRIRSWLRQILNWIEVRVEKRPWRKGKVKYTLAGGTVVLRGPSPPAGLLSADDEKDHGESDSPSFVLCATGPSSTQDERWALGLAS